MSEGFSFNSTQVNAITVGYLTKEKSFDRSLGAHKILVNKGVNYHLHILREGRETKPREIY